VKILLVGYGKMGQLVEAGAEDGCEIAAVVTEESGEGVETEVRGIDVAIDFSCPTPCRQSARRK
jgi:hypothetical protein